VISAHWTSVPDSILNNAPRRIQAAEVGR
jgi:hypothetical protein